MNLFCTLIKGINCKQDDTNIIETDAVVLAIPAGPSLSIEFTPELSVKKTHGRIEPRVVVT